MIEINHLFSIGRVRIPNKAASFIANADNRAKHFIDETQRVHAGLAAWDKGLIEEFGRLMSESCNG
jgi:galactokinase